ncbi:MFS transporter [Catellatospora tritici]|uniref:MFS transporter n=1 Tax=Catellatospora tritici TaxID=2851566 RepID=UPI001C2DB63C|nr:MFS transporter [Catellatospora tritici]MBV1851582.1 MFS transporter [Catellatospora tritici]
MLINGNYRRLWAGDLISSIGDQIFDTTVLLWIGSVLFQKDDPLAALAAGGVLAVSSIATVALAPVAGVFVDRWSKLRTMLTADLIRAVLVGVLVVAVFLPAGTLPVPAILTLSYVMIFGVSVASQFFYPSRITLIRDIVEGDADRARAMGIGQATNATAALIGPPLAAPLLVTVGFQWGLLINALSFVGSYAVLRTIRPPAQHEPAALSEHTSFRQEFRQGLAYSWRNTFVRVVLVAVVIVTVGMGALNTVNQFFLTENLHSPYIRFGFIGTAVGAGIIVGALLSGRLTQRFGQTTVFSGGIVAAGLTLLAYARSTNLIAGLATIFVLGFTLGALNSAFGALLMRVVDRSMLGRVMAILAPVRELSQLIGIGLAGLLAGSLIGVKVEAGPLTFGRFDLILTGAGVMVLLGGVYASLALRGKTVDAPVSEPAPQPVPENA